MVKNIRTFRVILRVITILMLFTFSSCSFDTLGLNSEPPIQLIPDEDKLSENEFSTNVPFNQLNGETMVFEHNKLTLEVSNVASSETKHGADDGGSPRETIVYTLYPGAQLTVIEADTRFNTQSGESSPEWAVGYLSGDHVQITNDMLSMEITTDTYGVFNLESSMYVLLFTICGAPLP